MRLAFKLFSACLLLEMMCLYHCFGQDVQQVSYPNQSTIHNSEDQVRPLESSPMDLIEFMEFKAGEENSEEDTDHDLNSSYLRGLYSAMNVNIREKDQTAIHRLLKFKKNQAPLFVLFHSWKFHLA